MENQFNKTPNPPIRCFRDLLVYQRLYKNMTLVLKEVITRLPKDERYDLVDQMRRASKAPPALLAEGFAKRYQKKSWKKYINDTIGECNEMIHHLSVCIDIYGNFVDTKMCGRLITSYDICCRQLTKLAQTWTNYHNKTE